MSTDSIPELLAELRSLVTSARSRPRSTSAVIDRSQLLDLVDRLDAAAAASPAENEIASAREEAVRIVGEAERERDRLVGETHVFRHAQHQADEIRRRAEDDAAGLRRDTDEYVDTRLADFEVVLARTLEAVSRGRGRLQSRSHFDELAEDATEGAAADAVPRDGDDWAAI